MQQCSAAQCHVSSWNSTRREPLQHTADGRASVRRHRRYVEEEDTFRQQQPLRDRSPQRSPKDDRKGAEALPKPLATASPKAKKVTSPPKAALLSSRRSTAAEPHCSVLRSCPIVRIAVATVRLRLQQRYRRSSAAAGRGA